MPDAPAYLDPEQPVDRRVADLVARMTVEEKIAQMVHDAPAIERLGVPKYDWWNEALHGVARAGVATVFPQPIGMAAAWNEPLLHQVAGVIADEARAKFHELAEKRGDRFRYRGLTFCSPNINIFRDPRWGRGHETYGECPFLTGRLGVAFIRGLQGDDPHYLKTVANAKHYAVHSGPENERHHFDAVVSEKDLRETYLPAFRDAVVEGKVFSVMGAYNRVNGEVCCGSPTLLGRILRQEWGFAGYVLSDCGAILDMHAHHKITADAAESSALGVKEGCDLNLGWIYDKGLPEALRRGLLTEAELDTALKRFMKARFLLGMFDPAERVPFTRIPFEVVGCAAHRALSRQMARESLVLLKNEGQVLPLAKEARSVLVVGPNADDRELLLGNYYGVASQPITPLEGIRQALSPQTKLWYSPGCRRSDPKPNQWLDSMDPWLNEAAAMAERADVVIACLGLSPLMEGEEGDAADSDGGGDRLHLDLPAPQRRLLDTLAATGKPLVVMLLNGGGLAIPHVHERAAAVLWAGYPGEEGGRAIADVLFGDHSPAGRLPVTWVASMDQLPPFADYRMAGRTYRYQTQPPLYPFGYGLSYTRFTYESLTLSRTTLPAGAEAAVEARVTVRNTGERDGDEVVQLYVRDEAATLAVPRHELRGFRRLHLRAGEAKTVSFTLDARALSLIDDQGRRVLEPGTFTLFVGGRQPDARSAELAGTAVLSAALEVTGEAQVLPY